MTSGRPEARAPDGTGRFSLEVRKHPRGPDRLVAVGARGMQVEPEESR